MEETLKMMESILTGKESKVDERELIKEYKEKLSPNILAYFYSSNYKLICKTNNLYPGILNEDKASFCLQELDKCLQNCNLDLENKFITYFIKCYKNRLRTEIKSLNVQKRKIIFSVDNLSLKEIDNYIDARNDKYFENDDDVLNNYNLTTVEKNQCKLLSAGYTLKEISNMFKQAQITAYLRNKQIKEKILNSTINLG